MNRRTFLATGSAGIAFGVAGCQGQLDRSEDSKQPETTPTDDGADDTTNGLRIGGVYADDIGREFLDGEYLLIKNTGADSLDVSGYFVEYPTGYTHQIADLVLEAGAQFALRSRDGEGSVFTMSPLSISGIWKLIRLRYSAREEAYVSETQRTTSSPRSPTRSSDVTTGPETGDKMACNHSISSES